MPTPDTASVIPITSRLLLTPKRRGGGSRRMIPRASHSNIRSSNELRAQRKRPQRDKEAPEPPTWGQVFPRGARTAPGAWNRLFPSRICSPRGSAYGADSVASDPNYFACVTFWTDWCCAISLNSSCLAVTVGHAPPRRPQSPGVAASAWPANLGEGRMATWDRQQDCRLMSALARRSASNRTSRHFRKVPIGDMLGLGWT